jgi:hypothetical protein
MAIIDDYALIPPDASDYSIDLFISYKRDPQIEYWMGRVVELVDRELAQALGGACTIFFDKQSIPPGTRWPAMLRRALQASRCIFGFWSPAYFTASEWCVTEWQTFKAREAQLELSDGWLTYPVRRDRGPFPQDFRQIQCPDLSPYSSTLPAFWQTPDALGLEQRLREMTEGLAERVARAPEYRPAFPFVPTKPYPRPPYQPRFTGAQLGSAA